MESDGVIVLLVRVVVGFITVAVVVQILRNRGPHSRTDARWGNLLLCCGLGLMALVQFVSTFLPQEMGWAEACTLVGTAGLACGLAWRETVIRDASIEHEQAKARMASQQRLLQTTFDAIPHVMAIKDADARLLMVNRAFCELTGADPDCIQGIRVADVPTIASDDAAPVDPEDQLILSGGEAIVETDRQHATQSGGVRDYHVIKVPLRDDGGQLDGLVVVGLDVTERKAAERALADNRRLLGEVFDAIPHFLTVKDGEGRYLMLNQAYTDIFGVTQDEATGHTPIEMSDRPHEEMAQIVADDHQVLSGATSRYTSERHRYNHAGDRLLVEIIKAPLHDAAGDLAGVVSLGIDITQRRRIEDELSMYRNQLQERVAERTRELEVAQHELVRSERLATIGQLTATVSHELRNPLGTISTSFHTVRRLMSKTDGRIEANLDRIERSIGRCVKIVEDLLSYTRLQSMSPERTHVDEWLKELCCELSFPSSIAVDLKLDSCAHVEIDRERLRQAVVNLIQNASQSILEESIDSEFSQPATIEISSTLRAGRLEICVRDSGPGISKEVMQHIFEPLYSTRSFGIGLGLSLVKQIAEGHGGGIELQSSPGQGTRATIWMPAMA